MHSHLFTLGVAFLLGSLPFGFWLGRLKGVDIRKQGSGNIGATNVGRILGRGWGYLVFGLDFGKGWLGVWVAREWGDATDHWVVTAGLFAVLGHVFTPWVGFRGGKGVATSAGVLLALTPLVGVLVAAVWGGAFLVSRIVSVASLFAATAFPLLVHQLDPHRPALQWAAWVLALLVWVRHRDNLKRLLQGKENGFGKKGKS
ncbi:MAG: glycerol-3-phosphate 1-O-acyltransferase [Verrucomicrobia bacterium]|nr:glycerol-3-phosphate 1-O-acyltransferase [Verrucomicrobiota bacterium]